MLKYIAKNKIVLIWIMCSAVIVAMYHSRITSPVIYVSTQEFDSYKLVRLVNNSRAENNLSELKLNDNLTKAAYLKAEDMFKYNYFEHVSPSGVESWYWFDKVNYDYDSAGENLAISYYSAMSAHQGLMSSDSHRDNILSEDFTEIGVAVIYDMFDNEQAIIVVEMFGSQN